MTWKFIQYIVFRLVCGLPKLLFILDLFAVWDIFIAFMLLVTSHLFFFKFSGNSI